MVLAHGAARPTLRVRCWPLGGTFTRQWLPAALFGGARPTPRVRCLPLGDMLHNRLPRPVARSV